MNNKDYDLFDQVVHTTLINIYSQSYSRKTIVLEDFDPKNKEHLYFLHVALTARDVFQFEIRVKLGWWKLFKLNFKLRKKYIRLKRAKSWECGIKVPEMLDFMRPLFENNNYSYAEIYEAYYKRGREMRKS